MNDTEIDRMLSRKDGILPSSGFVASVMEAVRNEAIAPPPIPFPWKRALPVLVLAGAALLTVLVVGLAGVAQIGRESGVASASASASPSPWSFLAGGVSPAVAWTGLALLLAFVSTKLSMRLAGVRS